MQRGYSIVELLVVIAILSLLAAIYLDVFYTANSRRALDSDALRVAAELREARSLALSAKDKSQFGVHFSAGQMTLFEGSSYAMGAASNTVSTLNVLVTASTSFSGGGADVIFQPLTGAVAQYGTITLSLVQSSSTQKTITVYQTGFTDVQ